MDHTSHTRLMQDDLTMATLEGATIYDQADEEIGVVSDMFQTGSDAHVIVDVGTFLGMGGKTVAIPVNALTFMEDEDGNVHATSTWSKSQIEALPEYDNV